VIVIGQYAPGKDLGIVFSTSIQYGIFAFEKSGYTLPNDRRMFIAGGRKNIIKVAIQIQMWRGVPGDSNILAVFEYCRLFFRGHLPP
jgi:hypothetical protein